MCTLDVMGLADSQPERLMLYMAVTVLTWQLGQHQPDERVEEEGGEDDDAEAAPLVALAGLERLVKHQLRADGAPGDRVDELRPALRAASQSTRLAVS